MLLFHFLSRVLLFSTLSSAVVISEPVKTVIVYVCDDGSNQTSAPDVVSQMPSTPFSYSTRSSSTTQLDSGAKSDAETLISSMKSGSTSTKESTGLETHTVSGMAPGPTEGSSSRSEVSTLGFTQGTTLTKPTASSVKASASNIPSDQSSYPTDSTETSAAGTSPSISPTATKDSSTNYIETPTTATSSILSPTATENSRTNSVETSTATSPILSETVTEDSSTSTDISSTEAGNSSIVASESSTATGISSTATRDTFTGTEDSSTTTGNSSTSPVNPSTVTETSSAASATSYTVTENSSTRAGGSSTETENSSTAIDNPSTATESPSTATENHSSATGHPSTEILPTSTENSSTTTEGSSTAADNSSTGTNSVNSTTTATTTAETSLNTSETATESPPSTNSIETTLSATPSATTDISPATTYTSPQVTGTLFPAIHWDNDLTDLQNLVPQNSSAIYYAEEAGLANPYLKHMYMHMKAQFTYPTVVLEHSEYVSSVICYQYGIILLLTEQAAQQIISQTWTDDVVVITFTDGCGTSSNSTRTYWLANLYGSGFSTEYNSYFAQLTADEILTEQGLSDADLSWGTYLPTAPVVPVDNNTYPDISECIIPPLTGWSLRNKVPQANPCNPNFDQALDDTIGYTYTGPYTRALNMVELEQKVVQLPDELAQINANQKSTVTAISDNGGVLSSLKEALELIEYVGSEIVSYVESWIPSIPNGDIQINVAPGGELVDTDWGPAIEMFKYPSDDDESSGKKLKREDSGDETGLDGSITVYCVDCGVHGDIQLSGSCSFSITDGVRSLSVGMAGSIQAGVQIGIDAEVTYSNSWSKELYSEGIPYLSVPDVITIGPLMSLDAKLDLELSAEGKVLTGAELSIGPFAANLDFVDSGNTYATGFDQTSFNKFFKAEGEIEATVTFSLPYSIGVGIDLPPLSWKKTIAIIDEPGIKAEIKYENEVTVGTIPGDGSSDHDSDNDDEKCNGIAWDVSLVNDVSINIFDIDTIDLLPWTSPPLVSGCYPLGSPGNQSTADDSGDSDSAVLPGTYTSMVDIGNQYAFYASPDGNIYLQLATAPNITYFENNGTSLIGDATGRGFYYYKNEFDTYGVSRVRMFTVGYVPTDATPFVFGIGDMDFDPSTPDIYFAVDLFNGALWPIACAITKQTGEQFTKILIAGDPVSAFTMLSDPTLESTVAGGVVAGCVYYQMVPGISNIS